MFIPLLGEMTSDARYDDSLCSAPFAVNMLEGRPLRFVVDGYEQDENPQDFDTAVANFLRLDANALKAAEPFVFHYYQDMNDNWDPSEEEYLSIDTPADVWEHIKFTTEATVSRRAYGDEGVYIVIGGECAWEVEHGLQIVFRNGKTVCRVSAYDGHLTNADAYANPQLEQLVYRAWA